MKLAAPADSVHVCLFAYEFLLDGSQVVKLVRAMRRGWIKMDQAPKQEEKVYLMWNDNMSQIAEKTANRAFQPLPEMQRMPFAK